MSQRSLSRIGFIALISVALLWPAIVDRAPFWFPDTSSYLRGADAATVSALDSPSIWSDRLVVAARPAHPDRIIGAPSTNASAAVPEQGVEPRVVPTRPVLTGRSIFYGLFLYIPVRMIGPWGGIMLQAILTAITLFVLFEIVIRSLGTRRMAWQAAIWTVLILATPLPFYTSMMMPDVFSGIFILSAVVCLIYRDRMSPAERIFLLTVNCVIITFHTTIMLIAVMLFAFALFAAGLGRLPWRRPIVVLVPAILAAVAGGALFSAAVKHSLGAPPLSPPFLSARQTANGPGTEFLRERCGKPGYHQYRLCAYLDRLPLPSDNFLWSGSASNGVFMASGPADMRALSKEDKRFFFDVVKSRPVPVAAHAMLSTAQLLFAFDLDNFNYNGRQQAGFDRSLPDPVLTDIHHSLAYRTRMPVSLTVVLTIASTIAALIYLVICLAQHLRRKDVRTELVLTIVFVIALVGCNALICGTFSYPHARYQMRLIWLLPALGLLAGAARSTPPPERQRVRQGQARSFQGAFDEDYHPDSVL